MSLIDLHVHSNASDGTLSPTEVVRLAFSSGLSAIALTDHDTTGGIPEALSAAEAVGIEVVPGIELSCVYEKTEIHILGLFIDWQAPDFQEELCRLLAVREQRNKEMLRRFQADGFPLTYSDLTGGCPHTVVTRAHFARALTEKGFASSISQAFQTYLQYGGRYCLRKELITPEHAMEILTANKAVPVLAHPCQYQLGWDETEALIASLSSLGMQGLEVYHSSHNPDQCQTLLSIAKKYRLLPTGGSDFHGTNKPDISIGTGRGTLHLPGTMLEDLRKAKRV